MFLLAFQTAPIAGKVMQTRSHSGFSAAVHKVAKYAIDIHTLCEYHMSLH